MAITGKKLGFKVGDFVFTGMFPGVIISDVGTYAPTCEVFGFEQEMGSCYASDLKPITSDQFRAMAQDQGHVQPFKVYGEATFKAMKSAGILVEKA